jgi:hypothetical protein
MPLDHLDKNSQRKVISESKKFFWDAPYLFKLGNDGVMRRCVPEEERLEILRKCHSAEYGGHYSHFRTQAKVWSSGFYWPEMHEDTKRSTTRNQALANAYIWLQYGCFGCIWNQLHRSLVVDRWLQLERCNSLRQP